MISGSTCTTLFTRSFGLLSRSFRAAVRPFSAVARAVGCGCPRLPLAGLPGLVRPSGGVWLLGCVLPGVSLVRCWWGSGAVVRLASAVPSALSGGVPVPPASRLSLPVSFWLSGGVWLRLARCRSRCSLSPPTATPSVSPPPLRFAPIRRRKLRGISQNEEFCIIPASRNYKPLPGYKTLILENCLRLIR